MSATVDDLMPAAAGYDTADAVAYGASTALVVVDVQHDFAHPEGGLYVPGGEEVVAVCNAHIAAAHEAGSPVHYTQDWHPPRTPHFDIDGGLWPVHCVANTWGAQLHGDLDVPFGASVVRKGVDGSDGYSGFSVQDPVSGDRAPTQLGGRLAADGVGRLIVTGLAGDVCVKATALDALRLGFQVVVPLAATRMVEREPGDGERAIAELREAGVEIVDA